MKLFFQWVIDKMDRFFSRILTTKKAPVLTVQKLFRRCYRISLWLHEWLFKTGFRRTSMEIERLLGFHTSKSSVRKRLSQLIEKKNWRRAMLLASKSDTQEKEYLLIELIQHGLVTAAHLFAEVILKRAMTQQEQIILFTRNPPDCPRPRNDGVTERFVKYLQKNREALI